MNKVKVAVKKPGPPVPPRPPASSISARSHSESRVSVQSTHPPVASRPSKASSKSPPATAGSPTEAGRTVIYKSPSFDLKKRQSADRCFGYQDEYVDRKNSMKAGDRNEEEEQPQKQQKPQKIFVSSQCNSHVSELENGNVVTIDNKSNRTEIVIINNNNSNNNTENNSEILRHNGPTPQVGSKVDNNNTIVTGGIPCTTIESSIMITDFPVVKISPTPKPRTLTLPKQSKSIDNGNTTKTRSDTIVIKNDFNDNRETNSVKNIETENNLKNAAERLFTEITVNQTQSNISKNKQFISVGSQGLASKESDRFLVAQKPPSPSRKCVSMRQRPEPEGGETITIPAPPDSNENFSQLSERKVAFHEILISELAAMRKKNLDQDSDDHESNDRGEKSKAKEKKEKSDASTKQERKRYPSGCSTDSSPYGTQRSARIRTSDWVEVGDNGKEVTLTSCHISLEDSGMEDEERLDDTSSGVGDSWDSVKDAEERMSLPDLPPLPKSLSGLELTGVPVHNSTAANLAAFDTKRNIAPISRMTAPQGGSNTTTSTLDTQLAVLRREMFGLRQLDLSLLSQLWALNESIQEFRTMLQEQETLSPPSPSPSPSEGNSVSSGDEDDLSSVGGGVMGKPQMTGSMHRMRSAPPPPPPARLAPQRPV